MTDYSETDEIKDTAISTTTMSGRIISAVALDKNKVFIAHSYGNNYYLYGIVCIIDEGKITVGTDTVISSTSNTGRVISAVALSENKVLIAHSYSSSDYVLRAVACTISGTVITTGTDTGFGLSVDTGRVISAIALSESKVLIAHSYSAVSGYGLAILICTIDGTTISKGSDTTITNNYAGNIISAIKVSENKVYIAHSYTSNLLLYSIIINVSGTSITKGMDTQLSNTVNSGKAISAVKLKENKVIIAHSSGSNLVLYISLVSINNTVLTVERDLDLGLSSNTGTIISAVALNESKVQIIHGNNNYYLCAVLCNVNNTIITRENDVQLTPISYSVYLISAVALSENDVLISHSYSSTCDLYVAVLSYLANLVKTITSSTEQINGIAITDGQAGEIVQVKKPDETFMCSFNASVTAEGKSVTWNNVILTHRKVLDGNTRVYSSVKSLEIGGIVYEFKFFIHYKEDTAVAWTGWKFGWEYSPKLYTSGATVPDNEYSYSSPITKTATRTAKLYTNELSKGVEITFSETENPINISTI